MMFRRVALFLETGKMRHLFLAFGVSFYSQFGGAVTLRITDISSNHGEVIISVYQHEDAWLKPSKAYAIKKFTSEHSKVEVKLDLPDGIYAFHGFQDENANGKLDMKWLPPGPSEPWIVSNNAKAKLGPPSFVDAKVSVNRDTVIDLKLNDP